MSWKKEIKETVQLNLFADLSAVEVEPVFAVERAKTKPVEAVEVQVEVHSACHALVEVSVAAEEWATLAQDLLASFQDCLLVLVEEEEAPSASEGTAACRGGQQPLSQQQKLSKSSS